MSSRYSSQHLFYKKWWECEKKQYCESNQSNTCVYQKLFILFFKKIEKPEKSGNPHNEQWNYYGEYKDNQNPNCRASIYRASYPPKSILSTPLTSTAKIEIIAKIFTFLSMNISLITASSITHFMPPVGVEPTRPFEHLAVLYFNAGGESRTPMPFRAHDFESCVSANSTTPAFIIVGGTCIPIPPRRRRIILSFHCGFWKIWYDRLHD
ncbi:MAG: hypothetical protein UY14_C0011G0003 [Parcubacteria group bacterium GW2011_GWA1_47_9]|nr:MAG: hypothetical protein UY14_C0011G0003 [Parcubacteria group bacterium GW2011_GWA1_47_9]